MTKQKKITLPVYTDPPLVEVVIGTQFESIKEYKAPFLWKLWERIGQEDFPGLEEVEPLRSPDPVSGHVLIEGLELPRHWFIHKDNTSLIQFQRDRFLFNWRKDKNNDISYPHYPQLIEEFYKNFGLFEKSLGDVKVKIPELRMLELTYINIIPLSYLEGDTGNIGRVFNHVEWKKSNLLPSPKAVNFQWLFDIEKLKSQMKIHVASAQQNEDGLPVLKVELTMKGAAPSSKIKECRQWFDGAREQLVQSFDDLTTDSIHKKWGKK